MQNITAKECAVHGTIYKDGKLCGELHGHYYPVSALVWSSESRSYVPVLDIPTMSDERYLEYCGDEFLSKCAAGEDPILCSLQNLPAAELERITSDFIKRHGGIYVPPQITDPGQKLLYSAYHVMRWREVEAASCPCKTVPIVYYK